MRVPLSWLRDYVDVQLSPERLAERLTLLGMEVKGIERWGGNWSSVVVGELLTVDRHPRADRLSLTTVLVGGGEVLQIVCGATNIAPGQRVPVALPGAVLPDGRQIQRAEKMGITSNGMLCSGDELGLTTDADGILILPPETPIGTELGALYADDVLDVDVKPNRGDALCLVGLAREVSVVTGAPVRLPAPTIVETGLRAVDRLVVEIEAPALCPRFVGRWISGVNVGPSPETVQMRLKAAGMRPISNVVDASNYVMLELGKPTHAFDAGAIHDHHLIVRTARQGERLETLDHVERSLDPETLVIADPRSVLAIAGIMGGAASEVGESTSDVVVESAIFDPVSIRRTGQRYGLRSEASLRFEKGQEARLARIGADRVSELIVAWSGGEVAAGRVDTEPDEPIQARVPFRPARVNRLLGTGLDPAEQGALLARVGISVATASQPQHVPISGDPQAASVETAPDEVIVAVIPSWRRDLVIEGDLAEEIARVHGYERIPPTLPDTPMPAHRPSPREARDLIRETLAGAGLSEVVTPALVAPALVDAFPAPDPPEAVVGREGAAAGLPIHVTNPLSSQHSVLRQGLLGSLLEVLVGNLRRGREDVAIFEIGKGYGRVSDEAHEWWRLGFALAGAAAPPAWNQDGRSWDLDDAKGLVELLGDRLGFAPATYRAETGHPVFHPGRTARVESPAAISGLLGELHPSVVEAWEIRSGRVIVGELAVRGLAGGPAPAVRMAPVPRHPAIGRDIAVVVAETTPAADVLEAIRRAAGPLLVDVRLFDVYRGAPLEGAEKSLAERLVFQAPDRTLTDAEVDEILASIVVALVRELNARLRG